jgi:translation initiation factor 1 (eIF-1/SUI1)
VSGKNRRLNTVLKGHKKGGVCENFAKIVKKDLLQLITIKTTKFIIGQYVTIVQGTEKTVRLYGQLGDILKNKYVINVE